VLDDVAVRERLLGHHQIELVEPPEVVGVRKRVVPVGVDHERQVREAVPYGADPVEILAFLDLHLDAVVLPGDRPFDGLQQVSRVSFKPMLIPDGIFFAGRPSSSWRATPFCAAIRMRHAFLDGRLGHAVAANAAEAPSSSPRVIPARRAAAGSP